MKPLAAYRSILASSVWVAASVSALTAQYVFPESRIQRVTDTYHGVEIVDPYRWLEDQQSAETRAWIENQNSFTSGVLSDLPGRERIADRLAEMLKIGIVGTPTVRGNRYFFSQRSADQDLFVIYMREGIDGVDLPLIDPHIMATETPMSVGLQAVSDDGSLLAYGIRQGGQDEVTIRFYDVDDRRVLGDHLPRARYFGVSITPDNSEIYYTRYDEEGARLYRRTLGDPDSERLIYGEGLPPEKIMFGQLSENGRWLLVTVLEGTSGGNDLYLMDLKGGPSTVTMVEGTGKNYQATFADNQIVIQTDWNAPNGRVMVAAVTDPARDAWQEMIPETEHVVQGMSLAGGYVWVNYLENVVGRVRGYDLSGEHFRDIQLPGIGTISGLAGDFERDEAFFSFASYNTPPTTIRYSVSSDERSEWYRQAIDFDSDAYEVRQVWYTSKDGTRVPMFLAHRKDIVLDGSHPVYLTAYGGFNVSVTPNFSAQNALWLERGGVLAVPNLRGGGEFGEAWHKAGMFENKQNVFDDFIAAAEWLIENGYTTPSRLAIAGGSNGGLLVGAAMTQRPDLYQAVVCAVPLLDMLRFHEFLVGRYWVSEYGSSTDPEQFAYLHEYSPYHNVVDGVAYPAVLFETGDGDTRVAPLHARKMTALMQSATASERPILLRYDTEAGHSGGLPVSKTIEDLTARLSFVMWQLGMLDENDAVGSLSSFSGLLHDESRTREHPVDVSSGGADGWSKDSGNTRENPGGTGDGGTARS